ncbi:MAG: 30S ribosomal protein S9 [Dehalococcoidia bacterium]|nr:ribosomal protein S9 [Dehalococcoidia bacterium]MBF8304166.1 ribosomal protein [Dehalococcoidia bacterium]MDO8635260.1 30S ribosomal protein S9 [Dehalococcoidia bacterium]
MAEQTFFYGVGRRKTSVARVRLVPGTGRVTIDGKSLEERFPQEIRRRAILQPFQTIDAQNKFDAVVQVLGGGVTGQAGAIRHGIARAFVAMDEKLKPALRKAGLLTRDPRCKERKKYGLKRARKAPQYTKR